MTMNLRTLLIVPVFAAALPCAATDSDFTLGLDRIDTRTLDPRTEARLAQWNSPLGRTEDHMRQQQAEILSGGQPGSGSGALAFRAKLQKGYRPRLVVGSSVAGVELYERTVTIIRWPWSDSDEPAVPLEEQLSLMLADRMRRSVGEPPAKPE